MIIETVRSLIRLLKEHIHENVKLSAGNIMELSELPVIVLSGPVLTEKKRLTRTPERITAIGDTNAVRAVPPTWYDLNFTVNLSCESMMALLELEKAFHHTVTAYPLLTAKTDMRTRQYIWTMPVMIGAAVSPNISQVFQGTGDITVHDVELYSDIMYEVPLIDRIYIELEQESIEISS